MCWLVQGRCGTDSSCSTSAWAAPSVHSERWMQYPRRRPIASSILGFDDEVEQSFRRPCRWLIGRSKRTAFPRGGGPCLPCYVRRLRLAEAARQRLQRKPVLARGPFSEGSEISRRLENAPVVRGGSK